MNLMKNKNITIYDTKSENFFQNVIWKLNPCTVFNRRTTELKMYGAEKVFLMEQCTFIKKYGYCGKMHIKNVNNQN